MKELWVEKYRPSSIGQYVFRDDKQKHQVQSWVESGAIPHLLFSGSAGTGKTTLMKTLVENLHYSKMSYSLLAPTGRAAKVLSKYTQRKTYTVHKKIYYSKVDSSGNFKSTLKTNKLKNIVFYLV